MAILVTGGAGYIGSHMVLALLDAGETPVVLDNLSTGFAFAVPASVPLIVGDFGDSDLVSALIIEHHITAIIHFAAKLVVPESVSDPLGYYLNNTAKARNLIECAVKGGVKQFIFSSTAAVYGNVGLEPVKEEASLHPVSPYGRSKLMVEWMLEDTARAHDLKFVVLRYFNVAGADPKGRAGQNTKDATLLIKVAVEVALGKRPALKVFGTDYDTRDGSGLRDYIHVTDLAAAHLDALTYLRAGNPSLIANCGYGTGYTVLEVINVVKQVSGVDFKIDLSPRRAGDPAAVIANPTRARTLLNWVPKHDNLTEIVTQALDWERRQHNQG
eukprot:gene13650-13766_t